MMLHPLLHDFHAFRRFRFDRCVATSEPTNLYTEGCTDSGCLFSLIVQIVCVQEMDSMKSLAFVLIATSHQESAQCPLMD
jgi:hypothetical protein